MSKLKDETKSPNVSRRSFLRTSSAVAALSGGTLLGCGATQPAAPAPATEPPKQPSAPIEPPAPVATEETPGKIRRYRTLGRTGFEASDISLGCGRIADANVVRYAYDNGINLFDTAETYGNGDSETKIGEAMAHMDREKIFIVTKLAIKPEDNEQTILDRYAKCLERMKTPYADALYMHNVRDVKLVKNEGFHSACAKLKADGKLKHAGISSHGPHEKTEAKMDEVLLAAVEDGRFDLMLLVYNFLNKEEAERILKACKEKNIGTTAMKVKAGRLAIDPFDPENPNEEYAGMIERMMGRGMKREEAVERIQKWLKGEMEDMEKNKPAVEAFVAKYGLKTQEELDAHSLRWVLGKPDMHSVCVSMPDFDKLEQFMKHSGTELTARGERFLKDYELALGHQYCRHGCKVCLPLCPHGVKVNSVMRYSYYFENQGREKDAMQKYARLGPNDANPCLNCNAPCMGGCPHGVQIRASLLKAHNKLTLA